MRNGLSRSSATVRIVKSSLRARIKSHSEKYLEGVGEKNVRAKRRAREKA